MDSAEYQLRLRGVGKEFPGVTGHGHAPARARRRLGREPAPRTLPVLVDVTFDVRVREFVAVIGPSGCGKTTLVKIVHGLIPPNSGVVELNGEPVVRPTFHCGLVFQNAGLLPWRTAQRNVEFGLETKGVHRAERRELAREYLRLVGLDGFEDYYPHQLSGGMQQRVGLARALAVQPKLLLMDEPFGALDAQTRERMQEELLRINQTSRKTVMFVTHDLDEAVYLADRVVVMAARPGQVREMVDIDLPRPRPPTAVVKSMPAFVETRRRIWELISKEQPEAPDRPAAPAGSAGPGGSADPEPVPGEPNVGLSRR
jgi:NitT/TauT family transport system ATP-binding protein